MYCRNCGRDLIGRPGICPGCGAKPTAGTGYCQACGSATDTLAEVCVHCGARLSRANVSPKSRLAAALLCFFLGELGIHRFYIGKIGTGVAILALNAVGTLTAWFLVGIPFLVVAGIWVFVDLILILIGVMRDADGLEITRW